MIKSTRYILLTIMMTLLSGSCAYYNTFYNAEQYYKKGLEELETLEEGKITTNVRRSFNSAIEKSNKVLLEYPDSRWVDDAAYMIAMSQYHKTDYMSARKSFEKFFASYPSSELRPKAEIWYGRCLYQMGEKELALRQLKKSSQREKNPLMRSEIFFALADLHRTSGNLDSAIIYYKETTDIRRDNPNAAKAQYNIAEINLIQNDVDLAIRNLKAVSNFNPSIELRDKMQILLARIYREDGQYEQARELIYDKLDDLANEAIWGELEIQLGLLYEAEEDWESARSRYSQITEKYTGKPAAAEAYYRLGELYMKQFSDYENAKKNYEQVKQENRNSRFVLPANNMVSEINRFFNLKKKYNQAWENVKPFVQKQEGVVDTSAIDNIETEDSDELKKALEQFQEEKAKIADTVSVFADYYQAMYEIGELYYFDFMNDDSAFHYFNKIYQMDYFNTIQDKALYAIYFLLQENGQAELAETYLDTMRMDFPESDYLRHIENRQVKIPEDNIQAHEMFLKAEKHFDFQPDSAVAIYTEIVDRFHDTKYAEKALLALAWLNHQRYYKLDESIQLYQTFVDTFPESEYLNYARKELSDLKDIDSWLAKSLNDTADDSTDTAVQPDSINTGKQEPDEIPDDEN